ncbi:starch synthase [Candidatus Epulonipiscium fishelsonii]|uniref:Starch synthase n=1 Tax=Candidatus Epulonipiscium fishelsonii TaxID=77094 RepID=A0ACC8XBN4_9FIRM|nr:starch synthase [Epulopiscium sp. SCG-B05WGA-EpuloA1]ONI40018.1 starch synthase [Epulopiscium sp. SCG-B11WGA-EpuloA1]
MLKCLFVSTEVAPYAKTGGLADVAGALPKELLAQGVDIRVAMPYYGMMQGKYFDDSAQSPINFDVFLGWKQHNVSIFYDDKIVPTYFYKNDHFYYRGGLYGYDDDYERFAFFCKAVLDSIQYIDFIPDIIHCNDWQTGPICVLLKDKYKWDKRYENIRSVFTIHNMKFQGVFGDYALNTLGLGGEYKSTDKIEFNGGISYLKAGLVYADFVTTVSPSYVEELKTYEYGCGFDGLLRDTVSSRMVGILNGIDTEKYNPADDPYIYEAYDVDHIWNKEKNKLEFQKEFGLKQNSRTMMIGIISRITDQKGFDLMKQTIEGKWFMDKLMDLNVQFVLLGTGDYEYENMFKHFNYVYGDRARVFLDFNEALAQKIYAACDVFLMPSAFEPCGLGQLIAMRYGTVPIVRKTGGLKDTVIHYNYQTKQGTGFEFEDYSGYWLYQKIKEAYDCYNYDHEDFKQIMKNDMSQSYGWNVSAKKYIRLYESVLAISNLWNQANLDVTNIWKECADEIYRVKVNLGKYINNDM